MSFGVYITNEYGILKQILSHLSSKDLLNASRVCREWQDVANRVILKNNEPVGYSKDGKLANWGTFNDKILPKIALHFTCIYSKKKLTSDFFIKLSEVYETKDLSVFKISSSYFIGSTLSDRELSIVSKLGKYNERALLLCDMPGVSINSFYFNLPLSQKDLLFLERISGPKGLILIAVGEDTTSLQLTQQIINIFNHDGNLQMVGGIAQRVGRFDSTLPDNFSKGVMGITFHGENITTHVGLVKLSTNIQQFMKEFSEEIGSLPRGGIRIAFRFSCICRIDMVHLEESSIFSEYFPNVPVYGFWSYGEFFISNKKTSDELHTCKRPKLTDRGWIHEESTSYLIVTLKK